ncbi:MAG: galactokinase [Solirubrobacteraceae bacterium]
MFERVVAFGPGRVNVIGEHTDYNDGLSLPFAIEQGVRVSAARESGGEIVACALDRGEQDRFALADPPRGAGGWRAFVRGMVVELRAAGHPVPAARLEISADLPAGVGLSSSAALEVALGLALSALAGVPAPDRMALARLCSRVEREWVGAQTGLLDQLASLFGQAEAALRIDFRSLAIEPVPFQLGGWRLVTVDSCEPHELSSSGYNERRAECERARVLLGLDSLRDAAPRDAARLPAPLDRRVRHVLEENDRVEQAVAALSAGDYVQLGCLIDASHASLRDLYECSTEAVEDTRARLQRAGVAGARMVGGGFGGQLLALLAPGAAAPPGALAVCPAAGGRLLETCRR